MSVLIRNMKMPTSCKSCDILQDYDGDMYCPLNDYLNFGDIENVPDYVMNSCPLVELPEKHGRLIDADVFMYIFADFLAKMLEWYGISVVKDVVFGAMTLLDV